MGILYLFVFLFLFISFDFYSSCRYNGEFNTVILAKDFFLFTNWETAFIWRRSCISSKHSCVGRLYMVRKELMFFSSKKIYADPCSILERPQAQLCGSAVHDPQEAGGEGVFLGLDLRKRGFFQLSHVSSHCPSFKCFRSWMGISRRALMSTVE